MFKVLVIDDEPSLLRLFKKILAKAGFRVETAVSGDEGLKKYHNGQYDVVITDILMSGMRGNHVADQIRNSPCPPAAVIGISGTPWELSEQDFDAILPKPFSPETLLVTIENILRHPAPPAPFDPGIRA
jgi:CheY-like chemotaxis protein